VLIEFAANLYAFPLGVELVVVPVALVFVALQAYASYDQSMTLAVRSDGVVVAIGMLCLIYFVVRALSDLGGFLSRESAEALLVGPLLTLALIPLFYGFAWLSCSEQENFRKRLGADGVPLR
jgi:hypothetical protein